MAYMDHGDGDHHEEQFKGDGDPQRNNGLYHVISVLMPFLLCSTFTCDNVFVYMRCFKLNGTNYADWIRNLRIVLRAEKKEEILDTPLPEEPTDNAPAAEKNAYKRACDADLERLEKLGFPIGPELATYFILASPPPSYGNFVVNYHMHGVEKGLNELCGMLKTAEADIKKGAGSSHVMAVQNKPKFKKKGNSWKKKKGKAKDEISKPNPPAPIAGPPTDAECFHCHGKGHISENRMKRLHSDGLLTSFDFESYETCEACLLGKMTKMPFTEKEFLKREKSGQKVYLEEVQDKPVGKDSTSDANVAEQVEIPVAIETPPQPRRSARIRELRGDLLLLDDDEPATYVEAMMDPYFEKWQSAMRSEIDSMGNN
ncbi:unnamed protein product [Miscanthus lutarioriparius]|uniref:GAG-pre-integrase domain-containing protein n=1 Tax=Miscanthus lutarioriparius TaxID=422564 RepID=A0A811QYK0_9POAL|nr:unnamed protein product [Miscanthus lutarioriparius]